MSESANRKTAASSRGQMANSGNGPSFVPVDIGHDTYMGLLAADTAFWSLVKKDQLANVLSNGSSLMLEYRDKQRTFAKEMETLRFGLTPSAVYFNPTERCNLNCSYCYIPTDMRRSGAHMGTKQLLDALDRLRTYLGQYVPAGRRPQVIFHGAEPMLNREAVFKGIEAFGNDFSFGIQTNATLLDDSAISFLRDHKVGIGLSLDGHEASITDETRKSWSNEGGVHDKVLWAIEKLNGYERFNVICTATTKNMHVLPQIVELLHQMNVETCMLNPVRCTLPGAREVKPADHELSTYYLSALEKSVELYEKTGRKLVVANFANILLGIIAPAARRLMCDISPCGGGRCFFAVAPNGDLFPCSEFIGLPHFRGGNLFADDIDDVLKSAPFKMVSERNVDTITPCNTCALRHFCGSPCPAEAHEMNGGMDAPGAFCELYEHQVRFALRLIADNRHEAFLFDNWDKDAQTIFQV
ncbi:MAG: peptide-modifying radical SAM enzyme CbpB [Deltaproteobacteria bacterium]|nr:peptide-modifying radical SAM enzyme CbpB [Deltaproteobacteria bacterium]